MPNRRYFESRHFDSIRTIVRFIQRLSERVDSSSIEPTFAGGLVIEGQSGYDENDHILTIMTDPQRRIDQVVLELSTHSIGVTRIWSETTRLAHLMKQWMKSS